MAFRTLRHVLRPAIREGTRHTFLLFAVRGAQGPREKDRTRSYFRGPTFWADRLPGARISFFTQGTLSREVKF